MDRNSFAAQLRRIAFTIPPLVMMQRDFLCNSQMGNVALREHLGTDDRVGGDEFALRVLELLRIEENAVGNSDLADVVKTACHLESAAGIGFPTEIRGEEGGQAANAI